MVQARRDRFQSARVYATVKWIERLPRSARLTNPITSASYTAELCRGGSCSTHSIVDVTASSPGTYAGSTTQFVNFSGTLGTRVNEHSTQSTAFDADDRFSTRISKAENGLTGDWSEASADWDIFNSFETPQAVDSSLPLFVPQLTSLSGNRITASLCFNPVRPELALPQGSLQLERYQIEFFIRRGETTLVSRKIVLPPDDGPDAGTHLRSGSCASGDSFYDPNQFVAGGSEGISAGKIFDVGFSVTPPGGPTETRAIRTLTPGGCPEQGNFAPPELTPTMYALTSSDRYFDGRYAGTSENRFSSTLRERGIIVPIYENMPTKTAPTSTQFWPADAFRYVAAIDDWELVLADAKPIVDAELVKRTPYKDCKSTEITVFKYAVPPDPNHPDREALSCEVVEGIVVPKRIGACILRVSVQRTSAVSGMNLRELSASTELTVAYYFTSLGASTPTSQPSSTTAPSNSIRIATKGLRATRSLSLRTLASLAELSYASRGTMTISVPKSSTRVCKVTRKSLLGLRRGTCEAKISLRLKSGATTTKTIFVRVFTG